MFDLPISFLVGLFEGFFGSEGSGISATGADGLVMGRLGDFPFIMHINDYKTLTKPVTAEFGSYKPIQGQEILSDTGGYGETIHINGILVAQPVKSTKTLEYYTKARSPLRLTTMTEDMQVVIKQSQFKQTHFYLTGSHRVQQYDLQLKGVYGGII